MKIQLPDRCPVCGAEKVNNNKGNDIQYKCNTFICTDYVFIVKAIGKCADKILVKFGTSEVTGYEEKDNANV